MRKLSSKTILFVLIQIVFILVILDIFTYNITRNFLLNDIRNELSTKIALAREKIKFAYFESNKLDALKEFADTVKISTGLRTTLIDKQGKVLADSEIPIRNIDTVENHLNRPEVQEALRTGSGLAIRTSATIGKKLIYYCENLRQNGRVIGFIRFAVFSSDFKRKMSFLFSLIIKTNILLFFIIIITSFIYWQILRRQLEALRKPLLDQKEEKFFKKLPDQKFEEFDCLKSDINSIGEKLGSLYQIKEGKITELLNVFNSLTEGVGAFNSDGHLINYNKAFVDILQLGSVDIQDRPFYDWLHFPPLIQDFEQYMNNRKSVKKRQKYYKQTFIEYQILPIKNGQTASAGFLVAVRDVTHIQELETIRQDFVANVSHEFKTPLTSIRGYAETLLSESAEDLKMNKKFLRKIEEQTRYLEFLVNDLLQLSRIEKKEITEISKINVIPIIQELGEEFHSIVHSKDIRFDLEIPFEETEIFIEANNNLVITLITNLINNAIQYNKPKGFIVMRVQAKQNLLRLEVEDSGIGIEEILHKRIFERFYRTEPARSLYTEGTGLGLSIVKNIVELLNGKIGVHSKPEQGSLFWVEIPKS